MRAENGASAAALRGLLERSGGGSTWPGAWRLARFTVTVLPSLIDAADLLVRTQGRCSARRDEEQALHTAPGQERKPSGGFRGAPRRARRSHDDLCAVRASSEHAVPPRASATERDSHAATERRRVAPCGRPDARFRTSRGRQRGRQRAVQRSVVSSRSANGLGSLGETAAFRTPQWRERFPVD